MKVVKKQNPPTWSTLGFCLCDSFQIITKMTPCVESGKCHCAETDQPSTMFTIKFGELPGSRMYTMKQPCSATLYVSFWPERTPFVHICLSFSGLMTCAKWARSSTFTPWMDVLHGCDLVKTTKCCPSKKSNHAQNTCIILFSVIFFFKSYFCYPASIPSLT